MFAEVIDEVMRERRGGLLSFGLAGTLWAASTGMYAVMRQLNITYQVEEARPFVRARITALGLSLMFIVLVLGAFSLVVLGGVIQDWIGNRWGYHSGFVDLLRNLPLGDHRARAVPRVRTDLLPGAERDRAFPFSFAGQLRRGRSTDTRDPRLFALCAHFANYDATYGSIGAVILLMFWLYIAGLVILLGAVINCRAQAISPASARSPCARPSLTGHARKLRL
jgi:membrane protein